MENPASEALIESPGSNNLFFGSGRYNFLELESEDYLPDSDSQTSLTKKVHLSDLSTYPNPRSQVLDNEDLLYLIFSFFHPQTNSKVFLLASPAPPPPGQSLMWAALTCKAFFLPVMRVLWFESSLSSLLQVIPGLKKRGKTYNLGEVIKDEHLLRLDLYSRCIKRLCISSSTEVISNQIYTLLSRLRYPTLLPGLRALKIQNISKQGLMINAPFLAISSTLRAVHIDRIDHETEVFLASLLHSISLEAHSLQNLALKGRLSHVTLDIVTSFLGLTFLFLEMHPTTTKPDFLRTCSELKTLRWLVLELDAQFTYAGTPTIFEFQSLQKLSLSASVNPMIKILQSLQAPGLLFMRLEVRSQGGFLDEELVTCIQRCVQITQSSASVLRLEGTVRAPWRALSPLRDFRNLKSLHINFLSLDTTDGDIQNSCINGEWATIEKLCIAYFGLASNALSPLALGIIARNCPSLETLDISIQVETDPDTTQKLQTEMRLNPRSHDNLVSLTIRTTYLEDESRRGSYSVTGAAVVSRYIDHCFPCLKEIKLEDSMNEDWCEGVGSMIKSYQEMRSKDRTT